MSRLKNDKYKRSRGGNSRLLELSCANCGEYLCTYQKDGVGTLKRLYLDRVANVEKYGSFLNLELDEIPNFACAHCKTLIGIPYIYKSESRLAYRLYKGTVTKKIINN